MAQALGEKLEHTGPAKKQRVVSVPQREQLAEPPWPKRKGTEPSIQSTRLWMGGKKSMWAKKKRIRARARSGVRVTRRGGRKALKRRSGIGEGERQPVMMRLAAQWSRSNLVKLITLKKGNHPGEA